MTKKRVYMQQVNKIVLVTGATGGIGAAVCRELAAKNFQPIIAYRADKESIAMHLAQECRGIPLLLELTDFVSIDHAIANLPKELIGIVHCASPAPNLTSFGRISDDDMQLFWQVNVLAPHRLFAGVVKQYLRKQQRGNIIALTSQAMGDHHSSAMAGMGAYTISKFGLCGVLALLAAEFSWLNVATVSPGFTDTKMLEVFDKRFLEKIPLRQPSDIAKEVLRHFEGICHDVTS